MCRLRFLHSYIISLKFGIVKSFSYFFIMLYSGKKMYTLKRRKLCLFPPEFPALAHLIFYLMQINYPQTEDILTTAIYKLPADVQIQNIPVISLAKKRYHFNKLLV